ncbi:MAG: hypothetical protein NW215_00035 [Hyphomicrobiales bacterium]|nr:hypothetical protein [Hyphomicrobiales bacterium]
MTASLIKPISVRDYLLSRGLETPGRRIATAAREIRLPFNMRQLRGVEPRRLRLPAAAGFGD